MSRTLAEERYETRDVNARLVARMLSADTDTDAAAAGSGGSR